MYIMTTTYNFDFKVEYKNDFEFRQCLRGLFHMELKPPNSNLDDITNDENNYDEKAVFNAMDYIYILTKSNTLFIELYKKAAAKMFSTDPNIGLSILFSYDYLSLFHRCLNEYKQHPMNFTDTNKSYMDLMAKM